MHGTAAGLQLWILALTVSDCRSIDFPSPLLIMCCSMNSHRDVLKEGNIFGNSQSRVRFLTFMCICFGIYIW